MATKQTKKTPAEAVPSLISNNKLQQMYLTMLKCRMLELHARNTNDGSSLKGKEAAAVGAVIDLGPEDTFVSPFRATVAGFLKDTPLRLLFSQLHTPASNHEKKKRKISARAGLSAQTAMATGIAIARGIGNTRNVTVAFLSQHPGLSEAGREAMLFAEAHKLPIIYVHIGASATVQDGAYGLPVIPVDGGDVVAVYRVAHECILRARQGGGPSVIACRTFSINESGKKSQDPLHNMEKYLSSKGLFTNEEKQRILHAFEKEIEQAIKAAKRAAASKDQADSTQHVFPL
jgi:TPP-dependent pyruvate/acetoin dehydrogenase alpha subunit